MHSVGVVLRTDGTDCGDGIIGFAPASTAYASAVVDKEDDVKGAEEVVLGIVRA